jgi:hypothetical protein
VTAPNDFEIAVRALLVANCRNAGESAILERRTLQDTKVHFWLLGVEKMAMMI